MLKSILSLVIFCVASSVHALDIKIVGQEFMPFQGTDGGKGMIGAYYDLTKKVCEKLNAKCTYEVFPLARAAKMVEDGEAHMLLGVAKTPEREAVMTFSPMISQVGYTFFVKKGQAGKFTKAEDFKGKTVGVHGSSATGKNLKEMSEAGGGLFKIEDENAVDVPLRKLVGGRYGDDGAAYCTRPVCMYIVKKENLALEAVSFDAKTQSHGIGLSKKSVNDALKNQIISAIKEVMKTPEIKKSFGDYNVTIHPDSQ